jgi:hypothetical protein
MLSSMNHCFQYRRNIPTLIFGWPYRQSVFLVEVSLHDDAALPVLSCVKILCEPWCPEGRLAV